MFAFWKSVMEAGIALRRRFQRVSTRKSYRQMFGHVVAAFLLSLPKRWIPYNGLQVLGHNLVFEIKFCFRIFNVVQHCEARS